MAIDVGRGSRKDSREAEFVERMRRMRNETFWPGRGIGIAKDCDQFERVISGPDKSVWFLYGAVASGPRNRLNLTVTDNNLRN